MRLVVAPLLVIVLAGATCQRRPEAPVADADLLCYRASLPSATDTGVRWECPNAEDPQCWDDLGGRAFPELARRALATEVSRQSCVDFITALKQRGIIRTKP